MKKFSQKAKSFEKSAHPAAHDSEYGWGKLFSERMYLAFHRNHGMEVHIARFHNIFGPEGTWTGGKEKAPATICRKVANKAGQAIEIWGNGKQTRSFLYIDECLDGLRRLMDSTFIGLVNIGSEESELRDLLVRHAVIGLLVPLYQPIDMIWRKGQVVLMMYIRFVAGQRSVFMKV